MCLFPKLIKNRKYIPNKKNGGIIPAINDKRVLFVPRGCGNCMECKKQKSREWRVRLSEEIRNNSNGKYITLTFSNESITKLVKEKNLPLKGYELDNELATIAMRRFLERWRKTYKKSIRHWFVTELGGNGTENIHMHGIVWTDKTNESISKHWKYGGITVGKRLYKDGKELNKYETGYVNEKTINYIVKYVHKTDEKHKEYKSKILCSQGIGKGYINRTDSEKNKYNDKGTNETYRTRSGIKTGLPIYYRNKIYSDEEREKLWLEKLDKQTRWVNGIEIDISKGEELYYKVLEQEREKNTKLGYGDDKKNWDRKRYENERRNMKVMERLKNVSQSPRARITPTEVEKTSVGIINPLKWEEIIKNQADIW